GTLSDVRRGYGDQLFGLRVDRPVFKHLGVELLEGFKQVGPQVAQFAQALDAFGRVEIVTHTHLLCWANYWLSVRPDFPREPVVEDRDRLAHHVFDDFPRRADLFQQTHRLPGDPGVHVFPTGLAGGFEDGESDQRLEGHRQGLQARGLELFLPLVSELTDRLTGHTAADDGVFAGRFDNRLLLEAFDTGLGRRQKGCAAPDAHRAERQCGDDAAAVGD